MGALLGEALRRFRAADGLLLAGALAFFVVSVALPLVLLGVATMGFVLSRAGAVEAVVGRLELVLPVYPDEIGGLLRGVVEARASVGLFGAAALVLFATPLFGAARLALERVLGVRHVGRPGHDLLRDGLMVGAVLVLLMGGTWIISLAAWAGRLTGGSAVVLRAGGALCALAFTLVLLFLAYRWLPRAAVSARAAWRGALTATVLWEAAKAAFGAYVAEFGLYHRFYGPLGVLVGALMLVYYSSVVFLFGAAMMAAGAGADPAAAGVLRSAPPNARRGHA